MLTMVIGGAASGKSEYAESLVLRSTHPRFYVATMQIWDKECAARVQRHRAMRAEKNFMTLECPYHLDTLVLPQSGVVLLEDIGNLVANELYSPAGAKAAAFDAVLDGIQNICRQSKEVIVVANEVFSGGTDYADDTDTYLRVMAKCNNAIAARADNVCRVVCGIPVYCKGGVR